MEKELLNWEEELGCVVTHTLDLFLFFKKISSFIFVLYYSIYTNSKTLKDYLKKYIKNTIFIFFHV